MALDESTITDIVNAVRTQEPVSGLTHNFYSYPARFSPRFAEAIIKTFTKQGDVVLDPFMGGGTTIVEATALGRRAIGCDINSLAIFVAQVKTTLLNVEELDQVKKWASTIEKELNLHNEPNPATYWREKGYQRNIGGKHTWPVRKTLELALAQIGSLPSEKQKRFVRCALLKTAQWAVDCKEEIPPAAKIRDTFLFTLDEMMKGINDYRMALENASGSNSFSSEKTIIIHRSAAGIETEELIAKVTPKLVLTSPPYPGVHVLYHRWQVSGRKETPAPYWITNSLDGAGESFYTFGNRKQKGLASYYDQAKAAFTSIAKIADPNTIIVQLIAFPEPAWQLERYLSMMEEAGFSEITFFKNFPNGRLWRDIPHRKWYAMNKGQIGSSKEVVLFHQVV